MDNLLGNYLKQRREQSGMSLREFADKLGISHSFLDKIEKGVDPRNNKPVEPTLVTYKSIAKGLGITLTQLLIFSGHIDNEFNDIELEFHEDEPDSYTLDDIKDALKLVAKKKKKG